MEKNITEVLELIGAGEYAKTKKNRLGAGMLRDALLELIEDMTNSRNYEGHKYQLNLLLVKEGEEFPKPFTTRILETSSREKTFEIHIKEITQLDWVEDGVLVEFNGYKRQITQPEKGSQ